MQKLIFALTLLILNAPLNANSIELRPNKWELLVIPGEPAGLSIADLLADDMGTLVYRQDWSLFVFDSSSQSYSSPESLDGQLSAGQAFWIIQTGDSSVNLDVPVSIPQVQPVVDSSCGSSDGCYPLQLPGSSSNTSSFHLVGSPFSDTVNVSDFRFATASSGSACATGCDLEQASAARYATNFVWAFDSSAERYIQTGIGDRLSPWQGFWAVVLPEAQDHEPRLSIPFQKDPTTACSYDGNPNNPSDDPNPPITDGFGRVPVTTVDPGLYSKRDGVTKFPTPLTTGICGVGLTPADLTPYTGPNKITTDGLVLDGYEITGELEINASNVTVRNSRITSSGRYGIEVRPGHTGILVEDTRIRSVGDDKDGIIVYSPTVMRRIHLTGGNDLFKPYSELTIEDSYLTGNYRHPGGHHDLVQVRSGKNIVFNGNSMITQFRGAENMMIQAKSGNIASSVIFTDNFVSGGNFGAYTSEAEEDGYVNNSQVTYNRVELDSFVYNWHAGDGQTTVTGNVDLSGNLVD